MDDLVLNSDCYKWICIDLYAEILATNVNNSLMRMGDTSPTGIHEIRGLLISHYWF